MVTALYVAAALSVLLNLIAGVLSGSVIAGTVTLTSGFITACLCVGVAGMLDRQEALRLRVEALHERNRRAVEKKTCLRCGAAYDGVLSSCPHCGNREEA